ncbi:FG-GAP repeat protein [Methyloprofundus sp.]|uniref:FG-GAP repeat protein n=1 Tax=Methyloprofundus sp. TaxID=2020875 RepID=UPI003D0AF316
MKSKILNLLKIGLLPALFISPALQAAPNIAEQILPNNGGDSVAISGQWAFVGDKDICQVFVYQFDSVTNLWGDGNGNAGDFYTRLLFNSGSCDLTTAGVGTSISAAGNLVVIGAPDAVGSGGGIFGSIFFFRYQPGATGTASRRGWKRILNVKLPLAERQRLSRYGASVSVRLEPGSPHIATLVAAAPLYDKGQGVNPDAADINNNEGRVYISRHNDSTGTTTLLGAEDGENIGDQFGTSVTSNGDEVLVGAPFHDTGPSGANIDAGAAYLFETNTLALIQKIDSSSAGQQLGLAVSLTPGTDSVMLLGGDGAVDGAVRLDLNSGTGLYEVQDNIANTKGGDVSQSSGVAGLGFKGEKVELYFNNHDTSVADWSVTKSEVDFGRDISVDGTDLRVLVNGHNNDRAYAYYTASCYHGGSLKANEWTMIGLQCDVSSAGAGGAATIDEIFTPDLGTYGDTGEWVMYKQVDNYEGHQPGYVIMASTETMIQGHGYWIIKDADKTWTIPTAIGDAATQTPVEADPRAGFFGRENVAAVQSTDLLTMLSSLTTPTADIRVMLSNPFPIAMDWSLTLFKSMGPARTPIEVAPFFEGLDNSAYVYKTGVGIHNGYLAIPANTPGMPREIAPGEGFFVRFSQIFKVGFLDANNPTAFLFAQSK